MGQGLDLAGGYSAGAGSDALQDAIRFKVAQVMANRDFALRQQQEQDRNRQWELGHRRQLEADKGLREQREAEALKDRADAEARKTRASGLKRLIDDPNTPSALRTLLTLNALGVANVGLHDVEGAGVHQAHVDADETRKRTTAFDDFKKRTDYTESVRSGRPNVVRGRLTIDDPSLPLGTQRYLADIRRKHATFQDAFGELNAYLQDPGTQRDHPKLSPQKAANALRQLYTGAGRGDDDLDSIIENAMSGGGGIQLSAPDLQGKQPSPAEAQLQQRATAVLQQLGKDTSPASVQRFLSNPQNRQRLMGGAQ